MRYIYLLLFTFIFAACGNQKMRFTRTKMTKQKVVELADIPSLKKKAETSAVPESTQEATEVAEVHSSPETSSQGQDESENEQTVFAIEEINQEHPVSADDSTTITHREKEEITNRALKAESFGRRSLLFGILVYVFIIAAFVFAILGLFGDIPTVVFIILACGILSLVSMVLGLIFGIRSLNASYNTPRGKRSAIAGLILSGIALGFLLLNILLGFL